jgi:ABC-type transporter MlaC component
MYVMKKNIFSCLLALSMLLFVTSASAEEPGVEYVKGRFNAILRDRNPSSIVDGMFDYENFVAESLGNHRDETSPEEREILAYLVGKIVSGSLGKRLSSMKGLVVEWEDDVEHNGEDIVVVSSVAQKNRPGDESTDVAYRVRRVGSTYKVIDVVIDDVSTLSNYRSQFHKVIVKGGIKGLITKMAKKAGVNAEDFGC